MTTPADENSKLTIICADNSSDDGAVIYNPNYWSGQSKGVIQSCWTLYSMLHHCSRQIASICINSDKLCSHHIQNIIKTWSASRFDLNKAVIFGQLPELHLTIEVFFSGVKKLLDLLSHMLSSEQVVNSQIDGFHRKGANYGGSVINTLKNNTSLNKRETAGIICTLICEHKILWIDQVISIRDHLVHPPKGIHQVMFELDFVEDGNSINCVRINPPVIQGENIDQYAQRILGRVTEFSTMFLDILRDAQQGRSAGGPDNY